MQLEVNGETRRFDGEMTIADLLEALEYTGRRVAVERNGEIVPRSLHGETPLSDGDKLEVVHAVGGG